MYAATGERVFEQPARCVGDANSIEHCAADAIRRIHPKASANHDVDVSERPNAAGGGERVEDTTVLAQVVWICRCRMFSQILAARDAESLYGAQAPRLERTVFETPDADRPINPLLAPIDVAIA